MLDEAVALQIHPRQPVPLGVPARDAHEVVLHAERLGILRDAVRHHDRDRSQHELAEHHVMDDPLPVAEVASGQNVGELVGPERLERPIVNRDAGERARDRLEQLRLHVGEAGLRRHRGRDPAGDEVHFVCVVFLNAGTANRVQRNELSPSLGAGGDDTSQARPAICRRLPDGDDELRAHPSLQVGGPEPLRERCRSRGDCAGQKVGSASFDLVTQRSPADERGGDFGRGRAPTLVFHLLDRRLCIESRSAEVGDDHVAIVVLVRLELEESRRFIGRSGTSRRR